MSTTGSGSIDPKDAGLLVSVIVDDLPRPAAQAERRMLIVRVMRHLRRDRHELPADARVRPLDADGLQPQPFTRRFPGTVHEFVVFTASYNRYDAASILRDIAAKFDTGKLVRVSSVRGLLHGTRMADVKETTEYEESR